jgi:hypothetical protein
MGGACGEAVHARPVCMAAIMAVAALVALRGLTRGVQQEEGEDGASPLASEDPDVDLYPAR